ncbi:unnamed protein product [Somion occarium]|uniref:Uncharacterized protein n=1 Tax=Somion occarium TaxID=3059160 RepID=A0ABP1EBB5_9APHY
MSSAQRGMRTGIANLFNDHTSVFTPTYRASETNEIDDVHPMYSDIEHRTFVRSTMIGVIGVQAKSFCDLHGGSNFRIRVPGSVATATRTFIVEDRSLALMEIPALDNWVVTQSHIVQGVTKVLSTICQNRSRLDGIIVLDSTNPEQVEQEYSHLVKALCGDIAPGIVVLAGRQPWSVSAGGLMPIIARYTGTLQSGNRILGMLLNRIPMRFHELEQVVRMYVMEKYQLKMEKKAHIENEEQKQRDRMRMGGGKDENSGDEEAQFHECQPAGVEHSKLEDELQDMKERMSRTIAELEKYPTEGELISKTVSEMGREVAAFRAKVDHLSDTFTSHEEQSEAQNEEVKAHLCAMEPRIKICTDDVEVLRDDVDDLRKQLEREVSTNQRMAEANSAQRVRLERQEDEIKMLRQDNKDLRAREQERANVVDTLRRELRALKEDNRRWSRVLAEMNERMAKMTGQIEHLQNRAAHEHEDDDGWFVA